MPTASYPYPFVLDGQLRYVLWIEDVDGAEDTVLVEGDQVVVVDTLAALGDVARAAGWFVNEYEGSALDLDALSAWIEAESGAPDPALVLNAWNLFGDVARSVGVRFEDRTPASDHVYDKVFAANNLPAMTPPGEEYVPDWASDELGTLRQTMAAGLQILLGTIPKHS